MAMVDITIEYRYRKDDLATLLHQGQTRYDWNSTIVKLFTAVIGKRVDPPSTVLSEAERKIMAWDGYSPLFVSLEEWENGPEVTLSAKVRDKLSSWEEIMGTK